MMNGKSLFLPLSATGLAHYFSRGLIVPSIYLQNKPLDIQDHYPESLLVSLKKYIKSADCSIELVLTEQEQSELIKINDECFLYQKPIPVSRIKKVFFIEDEKRRITEYDINAGAAFIPQGLFVTEVSSREEEVILNDVPENPKEDWEKTIKRFDKIMGGMAFMRLGGDEYMNYSPNYFPTLSFFNQLIEEDLVKQNIDPKSRLSGVFTGEGAWSKFTQLDIKRMSYSDVEEFAKTEGVNLVKKMGLISIDQIKPETKTYLFAILATYGEGKNKKAEDLVSEMYNGKFDKKRVEGITLLFGYHNGYTTLRNRYKVGSAEKPVKLEFNSKLDYYTVESIYQYVFNKKQLTRNFSYLDDWCPQLNVKAKSGTYKILDKVIIAKKKPQVRSKEYLEELFASISFAEVYTKITESLRRFFPPFVRLNEDESKHYFENELAQSINNKILKLRDRIAYDAEQETKPQIEDLKNELDENRNQIKQLENDLSKKNAVIRNLEEELGSLRERIKVMSQTTTTFIDKVLSLSPSEVENNTEENRDTETEKNSDAKNGSNKQKAPKTKPASKVKGKSGPKKNENKTDVNLEKDNGFTFTEDPSNTDGKTENNSSESTDGKI